MAPKGSKMPEEVLLSGVLDIEMSNLDNSLVVSAFRDLL